MKVLIVGANGQLGTTLVQTAPAAVDWEAVDLPECDITHGEAVDALVAAKQPDVVINAAAYTAVDRAEEAVAAAFAVNATGAKNLAVAVKKRGVRLIHVSTDYVFDGTACRPYPPQAPCRSIGVYGRSKREGEVYILNLIDDPVIIRTAWLYSSYGSNFVLTMLRLMRERDRIQVVSDQVGAPTWAMTLARAIWSMVQKPRLKGIYHWCDAGAASWYDFAVAIQEEALRIGHLKQAIPIRPIPSEAYPTAAQRPAYSLLDCQASWRDLGLEPLHWRVALRQMLETISVN
jgi:dTDP-4-dehydrorhamnose reductase